MLRLSENTLNKNLARWLCEISVLKSQRYSCTARLKDKLRSPECYSTFLNVRLKPQILLIGCKMTNQYLHIKSVFWQTSTLRPHSAYQLVVLTSTLLCAVVSMLLAKLYKSVLLSPYLAPSLTFMGNTTPEQSKQFRPSVHTGPVRTRRQTCWNFFNSLKVYNSQPCSPPSQSSFWLRLSMLKACVWK